MTCEEIGGFDVCMDILISVDILQCFQLQWLEEAAHSLYVHCLDYQSQSKIADGLYTKLALYTTEYFL